MRTVLEAGRDEQQHEYNIRMPAPLSWHLKLQQRGRYLYYGFVPLQLHTTKC